MKEGVILAQLKNEASKINVTINVPGNINLRKVIRLREG